MAKTIEQISGSFSSLSQRIVKTWPSFCPLESTLRQAVSWHLPALAPADARNLASDIATRLLEDLDGRKPSEVTASEYWEGLASQADQIDFANIGSNFEGVARSTFEFLFFASGELPPPAASVDWDQVKDADLIPKALSKRLRALEARIKDMEPRTEGLSEKIKEIDSAHSAAEQLPTVLEDLKAATETIVQAKDATLANEVMINGYLQNAEQELKIIRDLKVEAEKLIERCNEAYRITTSTGLAGAFEHRSKSLAAVGWFWVLLLIASLGVAVWLGKDRYDGIRSLLVSDHPPALVYLNIIFAVLGVAAPVWLAWLATRSIGQSFRLSEDYAFKASVSKAYEGYRREAVQLDEEFAKKLFGSALNRLDEAPSRFITSRDHSSPLEALLENEELRKFFSAFPEAQAKFTQFMVDAKATVGGVIAGSLGGSQLVESARKKSTKNDTD